MNKKFLVVGNVVRSIKDGELHYVSPNALCKLYKLDPVECLLIDGRDPKKLLFVDLKAFEKRFYPRADGQYPLVIEKVNLNDK